MAIGIALDTTYSYLAGFLPEDDWRRIISTCCRRWDCRSTFPSSASDLDADGSPHADSVLGGLDEFREHLGGTLTILMLRSIGAPFDVHEIRRDVMIRSIAVLRDFEHAQRRARSDP